MQTIKDGKVLGRILTQAERRFLNKRKYTHGFDVDCTPFQYSHIVNPSRQPLCGSPDLWFYGGKWNSPRGDGSLIEEDNRVTCDGCLDELKKFMKRK